MGSCLQAATTFHPTAMVMIPLMNWAKYARCVMILKAAWCVTIWADEYHGEMVAVLNGTRYGIYRTYQVNTEELELYLEQKVGV